MDAVAQIENKRITWTNTIMSSTLIPNNENESKDYAISNDIRHATVC